MPPERITVETDEHSAFRQALERVPPEQLTVLLVNHPATTWAELTAYLEEPSATG